MTLPQAGTLIDPRPGGELNAVFAGEGGKHNIIELRQYLIWFVQAVRFQQWGFIQESHVLPDRGGDIRGPVTGQLGI